MAEGVKKTFRKRYRDNLIRAMELKLGIEDAEKDGRAIVDALRAQRPCAHARAERRLPRG